MLEVISITSLSLILGTTLALVQYKFKKIRSIEIEKIEEALPGINCGACGFAGCQGYAQALLLENAKPNLCPPGGDELVKILADLTHQAKLKLEKKVARILCSGDLRTAKQKYLYHGITDCNQAVEMFGGTKECSFGCLGLGSCVRACAYDAIEIKDDLQVVVNESKCTGCEMCVSICPKDIIHMVPADTKIYNSCSSTDSGKDTKNSCNVGCTACKLCEKACQYDAIHIEDNIAVFDYTKCTECNDCTVVCPSESIQSWMPDEVKSERSKIALKDWVSSINSENLIQVSKSKT